MRIFPPREGGNTARPSPKATALPDFAAHAWRLLRIALDFVTTYLLPIPRSLKGVFRSVINHINGREEKSRPKQLEGLQFRRPKFAG
jgi:hypothetical protein